MNNRIIFQQLNGVMSAMPLLSANSDCSYFSRLTAISQLELGSLCNIQLSSKRLTSAEDKAILKSFPGVACSCSCTPHSFFSKGSVVERHLGVEVRAVEPTQQQPSASTVSSILCKKCEGNGAIVCTQCKGDGINKEDFFNGHFKAGTICWLCRGKRETLCGECNGAGFIGGFMSTFDD